MRDKTWLCLILITAFLVATVSAEGRKTSLNVLLGIYGVVLTKIYISIQILFVRTLIKIS